MAELLAVGSSQAFLFLQRPSLAASARLPHVRNLAASARLPHVRNLAIGCRAVSGDSRVSGEVFTVDNAGGGGGGGNGGRGDGGRGGGGDGGGGGGGGLEGEGEKKKAGMSMSQKLTLAYAALIGVGGVMGYMKSGSEKSLLAGGVSAAALYYVFTQLPSNPVFASSVGLGISAALLGVMGSRFKKSGKVFPAGVVSLVSLVMTAGYLHGIIRSTH